MSSSAFHIGTAVLTMSNMKAVKGTSNIETERSQNRVRTFRRRASHTGLQILLSKHEWRRWRRNAGVPQFGERMGPLHLSLRDDGERKVRDLKLNFTREASR